MAALGGAAPLGHGTSGCLLGAIHALGDSVNFLLPLGHKSVACPGPVTLDGVVSEASGSRLLHVDFALVQADSDFGVLVVGELDDLPIGGNIPVQIWIGNPPAGEAMLRETALRVDHRGILGLDRFQVRVDAHACFQLIARRCKVRVGAVLDVLSDVWLNPIPVASTCVSRWVTREQVLEQDRPAITVGNDPGYAFK